MDTISTPAPGVYDLTLETDPARYRAFLFDRERPTLVDCGLERTAETLLTRLDDLGIAPEVLVLTHADHDHAGGYDAVVDRYDPETYVPRQSTLDVSTPPDHRYGHEQRVGPFTVVHVPGHTADNYALVERETDVAVLGDALIGADWRGLPAGYFVLVEGIYSDDLRAAERNLERLQDYDFETGLVFHGSSVTEGARSKLDAFVDFPNRPDDWPEADGV